MRKQTELIIDEFTHLPVSRQRKHQLRKEKLGICSICTKPATSGNFCEVHRVSARTNALIRRRVELGIDLSLPLSKRGRPRYTDK